MTTNQDWPPDALTFACQTCETTEHATGVRMRRALRDRIKACRDSGHAVKVTGRETVDA